MVCGICSVRWIMKPRPRAARGPRRKRAASSGAWSCQRVPTAPVPAGLAPERREVARLGDGERRPECDLAMPDGDAAAESEVERPAQVDDGAADEHPGARLVEAALEERERRHGERGEPAHGELAEDQEEAGAELRHPSP